MRSERLGNAASIADVASPSAVAFLHGSGDMLILSETRHVIRMMLARSGLLIPFAGNGTDSFGGDGGSAQLAALSSPSDLAVRAGNSVLIADRANNRIREVLPNGTITTWLGNGAASSAGDGLQRASARVNAPISLAIHPITSDVFIVEYGGKRVRRVDARTNVVSLFIGQPAGSVAQVYISMSIPRVLLPLPGTRDMFMLADFCMIYRVNSTSGFVNIIAGNSICGNSGDGGSAVASRMGTVTGLAVDPATGTVLVSDYSNNIIRGFGTGGMLWRLAGETPSTITALYGDPAANVSVLGPSGLAWHPSSGALVIASTNGNLIQAVSSACLVSPAAVSLVPWHFGQRCAALRLQDRPHELPCYVSLIRPSSILAELKRDAVAIRVVVNYGVIDGVHQRFHIAICVYEHVCIPYTAVANFHPVSDREPLLHSEPHRLSVRHSFRHSHAFGNYKLIGNASAIDSDQARCPL